MHDYDLLSAVYEMKSFIKIITEERVFMRFLVENSENEQNLNGRLICNLCSAI